MKKLLTSGLLLGLAIAATGCASGFKSPDIAAARHAQMEQVRQARSPVNLQQPGIAPVVTLAPSQPVTMQPTAPQTVDAPAGKATFTAAAPQIQQVAFTTFGPTPTAPPQAKQKQIRQAAYFTPAEPKQDLSLVETDGYPMMGVTGNAFVGQYPDEYLYDGGDRGARVHYNQNTRLGVETEDTFAEYLDHTGESHVRASNTVAIYAPRFAAVRTITGSQEDVTIDRLAMASETNPGAAFVAKEALATSNRRSKASGMRMRQRGSELDTIDAGIAMLSQERAAGNVFYLKPLKRSRTQAGAQFEHANEAWLANRIQKAADWSLKSFPLIKATTSAAMEMDGKAQPEIYVHVDDKRNKGSLRIIKMADVDTAVAGDIITFTIEFENLGQKELYNVRIIDNLTPRLEFVENSASSDVPGKIVVEDNEHGSKILTFQLEGKIEGRAKGAVEFQARVR